MRLTRFVPPARSRSLRAALVSACVLGAATAVVVAEQMAVQRPRAEVLDAKGSAGDVIETIKLNGSLEVLGHEGPWVRVRTPSGKVGYVANAVFQKSSGGTDLSAASGSSTASRTEASAAGRGLDPDVENYIASKHLDPAALLRMQAIRDACRGKRLRSFEKTGNVGTK
jgi:hypothetical protein